jgi:hypothetical protein
MGYAIAALVLTILQFLPVSMAFAQTSSCSAMTPGQLTSLNGFVPFAPSSLWNTDISNAPVDANSNNLINYIGASVKLHPDFGAGTFGGQSIGIPYQIVGVTQSKVSVKLGASPDESDPGPMPIPSNALIEGFPAPGDGDRHVLVIDKDGCWLYELFNSNLLNSGNWSADSAAIWDLTIDEQRPYTWTSADAAGLPIFLGLARYDEVSSGAINHALRFTVPVTRQAFTPPASHWASSVTDPNAPPMGMRLRLKADFDSSSFSAANQAILTALKTYGMILADNGSAIYISGAPDNRWSNSDLGNLKTLTASDFEVVAMDQIYTSSNLPTGPPPTITSFAASSNLVTREKPVTLSWSISGAIYNIISPLVGPVRGSSVVVHPKSSTTYTMYSTNQYGRSIATVAVKVQLR